jgi:hypothetical protein
MGGADGAHPGSVRSRTRYRNSGIVSSTRAIPVELVRDGRRPIATARVAIRSVWHSQDAVQGWVPPATADRGNRPRLDQARVCQGAGSSGRVGNATQARLRRPRPWVREAR